MCEEENLREIFEKLALDIYLYYRNTEEDYKEAIERSQDILNQYPDNRNALMLKGFANFRLKKRKEAFEIYNEVLKLYENDKIQDDFTRILEQEIDISYSMIINEQRNIETLENYLISNQIEDKIYREL